MRAFQTVHVYHLLDTWFVANTELWVSMAGLAASARFAAAYTCWLYEITLKHENSVAIMPIRTMTGYRDSINRNPSSLSLCLRI